MEFISKKGLTPTTGEEGPKAALEGVMDRGDGQRGHHLYKNIQKMLEKGASIDDVNKYIC